MLYIGFVGDEAVPGKNGAKWKATNVSDFEASIKSLGDSLVQSLGTSSGGGSGGGGSGGGSGTCSWEGHCIGASCGSDDDCSDDYFCSNGKCTA